MPEKGSIDFKDHNPGCKGIPVSANAADPDKVYFHCYAPDCGYWKILDKPKGKAN